MSVLDRINGPYVVWQNYGYEGWHPHSFKTLEEAIKAQKYTTDWIITKIVAYEIKEKE